MSKDNLGYEDLLQIVDLIDKSARFSEFHLKVGEIEIDLSRARSGAAEPAPSAPPPSVEPPRGSELGEGANATPRPRSDERTPELAQFPPGSIVVKAPMVGVFYRAPEPGARPYVDVGSRVTPETTVCIIEVMKLMNSIPAGANGVVTHVLVADAAQVEHGQALIAIDPAG